MSGRAIVRSLLTLSLLVGVAAAPSSGCAERDAAASARPAAVPESASAPATAPAATSEPALTPAEAAGVEIIGITPSAAGQMLDLRYTVVDAERAKPLLDRSVKVALLDEATGREFPVPVPPKVGALRQTTMAPAEGRDYFMIFANPGGTIRPGARVALLVGDHRIPLSWRGLP